MPKLYFNKKIVSNAFVVGGKRAPFEVIGDNQGVLVLDDADPNNKEMIEGLTLAAREQRGGVLKIDETTYNDLKKKLPFSPSAQELKKRNQMLGVVQPLRKPQPKPAPSANRVVDSAPVDTQVYREPTPEWEGAPKNSQGLRLDGPTRQEFIDAGRDLANYPPRGYAERDTPASKDPAVQKHYRPKTAKLSKLDI